MNAAVESPAAIATRVAAEHAEAVDAQGRFPAESLAALKAGRLLGALVPVELGGQGAALREVAATCFGLGQACGSSALILAMHHIQVAALVLSAARDPWHRRFLARVAEEQLLLASVTSEESIGGNMRTSACAVELAHGRFTLVKRAPSISYGAHADALLVTARATPASPPSEQVLVTALPGEYRLERTARWNTLGMRGTCSDGFVLHAEGAAEQVSAVPFAELAERSMLPVSHLLWSAVWLGIATDALTRARAFLRVRGRAVQDTGAPGPRRLEAAAAELRGIRARTEAAMRRYECFEHAPDAPLGLAFTVELNSLKVTSSTQALHVVGEAMQICGIAAYKHGTPYSLGRQLRDIHSAPLMVNNDRIASNTASLLLAQRSPMMVF